MAARLGLLPGSATTRHWRLAGLRQHLAVAGGKRAVLNNLMQHAVETGARPANPLKAIKWTRPRTLQTVDPRTVWAGHSVDLLLRVYAKCMSGQQCEAKRASRKLRGLGITSS